AFLAATLTPEFGRLHPLAIEAASGGVWEASCLRASLGAQGVVEPLPGPAVMPWAETPRDPLPLRRLLGEHPPLATPSTPEKSAWTRAGRASSGWRPPGGGGGITSLLQCHAASVRSGGSSCAVIPPGDRPAATYGRLCKQPLKERR